jgi:hypothetical protein
MLTTPQKHTTGLHSSLPLWIGPSDLFRPIIMSGNVSLLGTWKVPWTSGGRVSTKRGNTTQKNAGRGKIQRVLITYSL